MEKIQDNTQKGVTKRDYLMVDPRLIIADETFNVRQDYGDIDELKNSIIENGVKQPLKGFRDKDGVSFRLTDGFRRMRAVTKAISEGHPIQRVPLILESKGYTSEQRLLDMFILNSGKRLTPLEESELFRRLEEYGWARKDIAKKIGKTEAHISNMLLLSKAPQAIKSTVANNQISATVVADLMRVEKNENRQKEIIEDAIEVARSEGKEKATSKHVNIVTEKNNNRKTTYVLTLLSSLQDDLKGIENERVDTFNNVIRYLNQDINIKNLMKYLRGFDIQ